MISRLASIFVAISLAIGVFLTVWGLGHMTWPEALPFGDYSLLTDTALRRYLTLLFVLTMAVTIGVKVGRRSPMLIGAGLLIAFTMFAGVVWPLVVTLWFAAASSILGWAILSVLSTEKNYLSWMVSFLVGAGIYGTAAGLLAHFPVNYPGIYAAALAAPLILGWRRLLQLKMAVNTWLVGRPSAETHITWLDIAIVIIALVHFATALMPEVGHDALTMHLFVPAHLALRHQWGFDISTYVWAVMPMLGDWIFGIGYMLAGEAAARMINVGFIFVLGWLVRDLVLWAGGTTLGARWAVLIFLSTPVTFTESSSLFIESMWSAFVIAGTLAVLRSCSSVGKPKIDLSVAGILLGCALAAKAVTFTILPVLLLLLIWRYKLWFSAASNRAILVGLGFFIILGFIPYVTAYWLTGNPIFPFFNNLFHSPYYPSVNFDPPAIFEKGITWDVLYRVTFNSERYLESKAGAAGFHWLLLLVPSVIALAIKRRQKPLAVLTVGILCIVLTFNSTAYLRYVFPSFLMLSSVIGVAFSNAFSYQPFMRRLCFIVAGFAVGLNLLFLKAGTNYGDFEFGSLVSASSRESYLQNHLPIRNAVELVNRLNTGRTPVAVFSSPLTAGLTADGLYPTWYNHEFQSLIKAIGTEHEFAEALQSKGVDFIILDENWGSAEKRLLIESATEKVAVLGPISVRTWPKESRFRTELLKNPDFATSDGWALPTKDAIRTNDGISVTVTSAAYQIVPVKQGRRYLNVIKARCAEQKTQGRMQVNWLDSKSQFISADIRVFDCSLSSVEHSMEVVAPPKAAHAVVYTSGHTPIPLMFNENSFRQ